MRFLGLNLLEWTALAALAGFLLAAVTVTGLVFTGYLAKSERERDDRQRREDRQHDDDKRREDREHDAEIRRQDRERADQLRAEDDLKWERRMRAEQQEREDREAREVTVQMKYDSPISQAQREASRGLAAGHSHLITVCAPVPYELKHTEAHIVHASGTSLSMIPTGWKPDASVIEDGRVVVRIKAEIPPSIRDPYPIVRFTNNHGHLYYSYRGRTQRFAQSTDWPQALYELDQWARRGPEPDERPE